MRLRRKDEVVIFIGKTASRCILGGAIEAQVSLSDSKRTPIPRAKSNTTT